MLGALMAAVEMVVLAEKAAMAVMVQPVLVLAIMAKVAKVETAVTAEPVVCTVVGAAPPEQEGLV